MKLLYPLLLISSLCLSTFAYSRDEIVLAVPDGHKFVVAESDSHSFANAGKTNGLFRFGDFSYEDAEEACRTKDHDANWQLPEIDELRVMFENRESISNLKDDWYWSSTVKIKGWIRNGPYVTRMLTMNMTNGAVASWDIYSAPLRVRCIRKLP